MILEGCRKGGQREGEKRKGLAYRCRRASLLTYWQGCFDCLFSLSGLLVSFAATAAKKQKNCKGVDSGMNLCSSLRLLAGDVRTSKVSQHEVVFDMLYNVIAHWGNRTSFATGEIRGTKRESYE